MSKPDYGEVALTAYAAAKTDLQDSADTGASPAERVEDASG